MRKEIRKPIIFKRREEAPSHMVIIDIFNRALHELFFIENPQLRVKSAVAVKNLLKDFINKHKKDEVWIHYPWQNTLVHCVTEDLYFKIRTARNRNLITEAEQHNYRGVKIGIAGLSVGSGVLSALVLSGGPKTIKIADYDVLEISNLNRIRAKLTDVGMNKTLVAAREVWEIDPFADLRLWKSGLTRNTVEEFILGKPRLDVFVDEVDSIEVKIAARKICKKERIPVIMATDNGDNIILDIERFDQEPDQPIFHGDVDPKKFKYFKDMSFKQWLRIVTMIIGPSRMSERHQESILQVGKSIYGIPQLGTTVSIAGAAVAFAIRRIANREKMSSGRYIIGLEEKLIQGYTGVKQKRLRMNKTRKFIRAVMGAMDSK